MSFKNKPENNGKKYIVQELFEIYQMAKLPAFKRNFKLLAKKLGRSRSGIGGIKGILIKMVDAESDSIARSIGLRSVFSGDTVESCMQVRELILSGQNISSAPVVVETKTEVEAKPAQDRFTRLETALNDFQNALSDFIDEEVAIKTENQKRIYEQKISELEEVVEKAKGSNWIGSLRQKFQPV